MGKVTLLCLLLAFPRGAWSEERGDDGTCSAKPDGGQKVVTKHDSERILNEWKEVSTTRKDSAAGKFTDASRKQKIPPLNVNSKTISKPKKDVVKPATGAKEKIVRALHKEESFVSPSKSKAKERKASSE